MLQKITTEYSEAEDRIRLSGEGANAAAVVVWLTQRLLQRLLPLLWQWLQEQGGDMPGGDVLQEFAQEAARAGLEPQAPVRPAKDSAVWLAQLVNVERAPDTLRLTFKSAGGQQAVLALQAKPLRQWLNILHDLHANAGWSLDAWPQWVRDAAPRSQAALFH